VHVNGNIARRHTLTVVFIDTPSTSNAGMTKTALDALNGVVSGVDVSDWYLVCCVSSMAAVANELHQTPWLSIGM
jgi:hypothetical protein